MKEKDKKEVLKRLHNDGFVEDKDYFSKIEEIEKKVEELRKEVERKRKENDHYLSRLPEGFIFAI